MAHVFEEIRQQIHEIRNLINPFDLRLAALDVQIAASRTLFMESISALEIKVMANTFRTDEHTSKIEDILEYYGQLSERVKRLETEIKLCLKPESVKPLPVRADGTAPNIDPPLSSAP